MRIILDGKPLTPDAVHAVATAAASVHVPAATLRRVAACRRAMLAAADDGEPHYGINTGFGSLARQRIASDQLKQLQRNLVRSHAAGAGPALPTPVVRATMLCLAASLARAHSAVRPVVVQQIVDLLNAGITPVVPELGSVGASGDLAPLAHIALVLVGEGRAQFRGREMDAAEALRRARLRPLVLEAKEGLALINGTHLMAGRFALLRVQWDRLLPAALVATAMSLDACRATDAFLDARVYRARNQPGAAAVAAEFRRLIAGSQILPSHRKDDPRVQDPYSFRCAAIVLGAVCDALRGVWSALDHELGAVTDNPLVFPESASKKPASLVAPTGQNKIAQGNALGKPAQKRQSPEGATQQVAPFSTPSEAAASGKTIVSAGNFHGMPVALPLDLLAVSVTHVAGIAERRVYHMISAFDPESHLNPFLTPHPGLESGLMVTQYTAAAACNELIGLAAPASVANLSTCAGMEDYNSFGPRAAAKAERALDLVTTVIAIELLCAAQGLEYHRPLRSSKAVEAAHRIIRRRVKKLTADRPLAPDIERIRQLILSGEFKPLVGRL